MRQQAAQPAALSVSTISLTHSPYPLVPHCEPHLLTSRTHSLTHSLTHRSSSARHQLCSSSAARYAIVSDRLKQRSTSTTTQYFLPVTASTTAQRAARRSLTQRSLRSQRFSQSLPLFISVSAQPLIRWLLQTYRAVALSASAYLCLGASLSLLPPSSGSLLLPECGVMSAFVPLQLCLTSGTCVYISWFRVPVRPSSRSDSLCVAVACSFASPSWVVSRVRKRVLTVVFTVCVCFFFKTRK